MTFRRAAKVSALLALLGALGPRPAVAADRSCSPVVDADAGVRHRWPELPERVSALFGDRDDIDACARVALTLGDDSISVAVRLQDGRSAARSVPRAEDVLPVVEALLLVPEHEPAVAREDPEPTPAPPAPAPPPNVYSAPASIRPPVADRVAPNGSPSSSPDRLRVELSVGAGARVGDGQNSTGLAAFSFLEVDGWLAGFEGRIDRYDRIGGGSEAAALELAALGGRRLRIESVALDFSAGPVVVVQGRATSVTETQPGGHRITESSSSNVLRLLCGARLNFNTRSTVRTFLGVDGEFGPRRAPGADLPADAPRLPRWTVGLALGATVGTP